MQKWSRRLADNNLGNHWQDDHVALLSSAMRPRDKQQAAELGPLRRFLWVWPLSRSARVAATSRQDLLLLALLLGVVSAFSGANHICIK